MRTIFSLILGFLIFTNLNAQKKDLSLDLQVGNTYKQSSAVSLTMGQQMGGQLMNIKMTISGSNDFTVKDLKDGAYTMETKYTALKMKMEMPQGTMEYSSDGTGEDLISKMLNGMVSKPFTVVLSKKGKVLAINDYDKLWDVAFASIPEISEENKAQIQEEIKQSYGADALKGNIEAATAIYSETPVEKGDSWDITTSLDSTISLNQNSTYTYVDTTPDYTLISGKATLTSSKESVKSAAGEMEYALDGTNTSTIKVDNASGWIIEAVIDQNIKGSISIEGNPAMPDGMTIPMEVTSTSTVTNK